MVAAMMSQLAELVEFNLDEIWFEFVMVLGMVLFFSVCKAFNIVSPQKPKKRKSVGEPKSPMTQIEIDVQNGNCMRAMKTWRSTQATTPLTQASVRPVVQALLEISPETLVEEVVAHMKLHPATATPQSAHSVLDTVARAAKNRPELMKPTVKAMLSQLVIKPTPQIHEAILGGYAFGNMFEELQRYKSFIVESGDKMTPRGFSLALRGLLQHKRAADAVKLAKEMPQHGFSVPPFAVLEITKVMCENKRGSEVLNTILPEITLTPEAASALLESCLKAQDVELVPYAMRVRDVLMGSGKALCQKGYDALLKLLAYAADLRASEVFEQMQKEKSVQITEGFCVGLLARCAESKFLRFADVVVKYAKEHLKMTVAMYSALMKVYAYSGMYEKACDIYEDLLADGLEPDHTMYNCLMKFAGLCGRTELSAKLAQKVPALDIQNCMSLIRSAYHDKDVSRACDILAKLKASGQALDAAAYNCCLDVCAVAGDDKHAQKILADMKACQVKPDMITYNTVLKCYGVKKDIAGARRLLAQMEADGYSPNDISYNVIINMAVSSGDFKSAWEAVDKMTASGIAIDQYTVSTMMKAVKKSKSHKDVMLVFELLDKSGVEVVSDEVLLNTVLETSIRHRESKRVQAVLASYAARKTTFRPAMHTYGMLIRANSMLQRVDACRDLWSEMVDHRGLVPNEVVMGCMLDALVCNNCLEDALALLVKMRAMVKPNAVMYSTLLKGLANAKNGARAIELLEDMKKDGVAMTTSVYNSLIDVQARAGNTEEVLRLRTLMEQDNCAPDDFTHSLIVKAHAMRGDLRKGLEVFEALCVGRTKPKDGDTVVFNTLLDGCVRHNNFRLADELLKKLEDYNIQPTNFTLGIVVKMWGRRRKLNEAFHAVRTMTSKYGFSVNGPVRTCLLSACLLNDDLDRALEVFHNFDGPADSKAFSNLISGASRLGRVEVAVELTEEAFGLNGKRPSIKAKDIDTSVLDQLARALVKAGKMETVGMPLFGKLHANGVAVQTQLTSMLHSAAVGQHHRSNFR
eukprot:TRINITY_DN32817_c0_g1_i1.p1 TRINITY_DN32817_c0_g1~~TRINITY_DN32817_c0_g1_i1.p1  ORF type:complete len:1033 (-),score=307.54 TRINITY_DN32817_c0_g1_i1:481-3579(-)